MFDNFKDNNLNKEITHTPGGSWNIILIMDELRWSLFSVADPVCLADLSLSCVLCTQSVANLEASFRERMLLSCAQL